MANPAQGFNTKSAFRVEGGQLGIDTSAYPTSTATADTEEVPLGGSDLFPLESEGIDEEHNFEADQTVIGVAGETSLDLTGIKPSGSLSCVGTYDGLSALVGCAMGFINPATPSALPASIVQGVCETIGGGQTNANVFATTTPFVAGDVGKYVRITAGAGEGQVRIISSFTSTAEVATAPNWTVIPDDDSFEIHNAWNAWYEVSNNLCDELWTTAYASYPTGGVGTASDKIIRRGTLGFDKTASLWIFRSSMVNTMNISGNAGESLKFGFDMLPFDLDTSDTGQNTVSTAWALNYASGDQTQTELLEKVMFNDLTIWVATFHASTVFDNDDKVSISAFSIEVNNNLNGDDQDSISGTYRSAPARDNFRTVTGTFTVPRYTADTWINYRANKTELMCNLQFQGSAIVGVGARELSLFIPSMTITGVGAPTSGAGIITQAVSWKALIPSEIPAMHAEDLGTYVKLSSPYPEFVIKMANANPFNVFRDQNQAY
jgi:hypothetical protein